MNKMDPKHIIISGEIGIGKTTVCTRLIEYSRGLGISISGILTMKTDDGNRIVEDIITGTRKKLAILLSHPDGTSESGFTFLDEGVRFGNSAIRNSGGEDIILIDEIGPLEMNGKGFIAYEELLDSKSPVHCILVIRKSILPLFLEKYPILFTVFEVTESNRSDLHKTIFESIEKNHQYTNLSY